MSTPILFLYCEVPHIELPAIGDLNLRKRVRARQSSSRVKRFGKATPGNGASRNKISFRPDLFIEPRNCGFRHDWMGAKWYFASAANRDEFAKNPEKYAPQFGGYCAWAVGNGYTASIDPTAWKIVDGKLYLNYSLFRHLSGWSGVAETTIRAAKKHSEDKVWEHLQMRLLQNPLTLDIALIGTHQPVSAY